MSVINLPFSCRNRNRGGGTQQSKDQVANCNKESGRDNHSNKNPQKSDKIIELICFDVAKKLNAFCKDTHFNGEFDWFYFNQSSFHQVGDENFKSNLQQYSSLSLRGNLIFLFLCIN